MIRFICNWANTFEITPTITSILFLEIALENENLELFQLTIDSFHILLLTMYKSDTSYWAQQSDRLGDNIHLKISV